MGAKKCASGVGEEMDATTLPLDHCVGMDLVEMDQCDNLLRPMGRWHILLTHLSKHAHQFPPLNSTAYALFKNIAHIMSSLEAEL